MTDRFCIATLHAASRCPRSRGSDGRPVHDRRAVERVKEAVRHRRDRSRRTPTCAAPGSAARACARSTTSARRRSRSTRRRSSTTASAARRGATCSGSSRRRRGSRFADAVEALADRYGVELEREREDPRAEEQRRSARAARASCSSGRPASTRSYLWESPKAAKARDYLAARGLGRGGAAGVRGRLRAERLGPGADPRPAGRVLDRGAARRRGWSRRARQGAATTTASGRGSCSRSATRAGACWASARGRCARPEAEVPELAGGRALPQEPHAVRDRPGAGGDRQGGRARRGRGLHGRARAAPGRDRGGGRDHGHGDHAGAGAAALRRTRRRWCWRSTPTAPGARRCCARSAVAGQAAAAAGRRDAGGRGPGGHASAATGRARSRFATLVEEAVDLPVFQVETAARRRPT